jgi:hypothetical protein
MAGPQGIGPGGNPPQIIHQPGTGNIGNVGGVQPGAVRPDAAPRPGAAPQAPAPREPVRAADVAGQLDILLLKAVQGSTGSITEKAVAKAATSANLPRETKNRLKELAGKARECLAALDAFSGKDLASAMEKKADGTIDWKEGNRAAKAFVAAQEAQEALSSELAKAFGKAKNGESQAVLEELMLQCDRRIGEMETLVLQMTEIVDAGGDKAEEKAGALAEGGAISSYTSAGALDKFGRAGMLAALQSDLKPLTDRLAAYERNGSQGLRKADIDACAAELDALKAKFSAAAASGELQVGDKTVAADRSLLAEASKLLDGVGKKINAIHREVLRAAMVQFVEKDIPFIEEEIFSEQFAGELHKLKGGAKIDTQALEDFAKRHNEFKAAARAYAQSPTKANEAKFKNAAKALGEELTQEAYECLSFKAITTCTVANNASPDFKAAFKKFHGKVLADAAGLADPNDPTALQKMFGSVFGNIGIAVEKLLSFGKEFNAGKADKYYVSGAVLDAFRGGTSLTPLLESRVHGYADSDVNTALDDKNVAESKTLGAGNFNTVTLVKARDGSEWVFKPEMAGRLAAPGSTLNDGLAANQEMTRINLAAQQTADVLGLGDVMVKTTAGTHQGQFGMFMEKAPGITGKRFKATQEPLAEPGKAGPAEIRKLGDADFGKVAGRMMRQFNRLQWFDIITGQGDRHADNYMIDIDTPGLTVTLKAIDNDACYGIFRQGLHTFRLAPGSEMKSRFEEALDQIATGNEDLKEDILSDPGVKRKGGAIEIDLSKSDNPLLLAGLLKGCGLKNTVPPEEMDRELYDKLMCLAKDAPDGGAAREAHLSSLAERLGKGSAQFKAAVRRLDESIEYARQLNAKGKVYSAGQWEDHDVQCQIAKPNLRNMNEKIGTYGKMKQDLADSISNGSHYVTYSNTFFRDFFATLLKGTDRANWFNG